MKKKTWAFAVLGVVGVAVLAITFTLRRQAADSRRDRRVVGVKIYEYSGSFPALFAAWRDTGINTSFVSPALQSQPEFRALAKANGIATFIIFPVFCDAEELAKRPELYAVTDRGTPAEESWVKFVCPTRADYRTA
jgi:hypothetical protein